MIYDANAGLYAGKFTPGNPATGIPPSRLTSDWMNAVSDEILAVIAGGGLTPSANNTQAAAVIDVIRQQSAGIKALTDALAVRSGALWEAVLPVGTILHLAAPETPAGFIACNGANINRTSYDRLYKLFFFMQDGITPRFSPKTCTVSVASPGVFTSAAHGFVGGERLRFSSTGTMPTGLSAVLDYYVDPTGITTTTFYLVNTAGGTRINITGAGSGSLSCLQSYFGVGNGVDTFTLPDLRGVFLRGYESGVFGKYYLDQMQGHFHASYVGNGNTGTSPNYGSMSTQLVTINLAYPMTAITDGVNGTPRIGNETYPRHMTVWVGIKY